MKKQLKTLIAAGLITICSASSISTSHADSKLAKCKYFNPKLQFIYIDSTGKVYTYDLNCNNKPSIPDCDVDDNNTVPEDNNKPTTPDGDINDNNTVPPEEDNNKPDIPDSDINDDNTIKPDYDNDDNTIKPDDNNDNSNGNDNNNKPEVDTSFSAFQNEVLSLVNQERAKVGANPLTLNKELSDVATIKSQDMIDKNYFDHNSPTYGSPFDMMNQFGISYSAAGENIAMGQTSPQDVMNSWMNSPGHRKNILSSDFTELGVGVAKNSNGQLYWTQMFIGR